MNRVLIVEDDFAQLSFLESTIKTAYPLWQVDVCSDYDSAISLIDESLTRKNPFSLFLFDIQLSLEAGNKDGFRIAAYAREHEQYYKTPILFLTAITDQIYFALSNYHCHSYMPKPYSKEDLLSQIQHMLITGYINETTIKVKDTDSFIHYVIPSDICYIKAALHLLKIHTVNSVIETRQYSLSSLVNKLGPDFIQCHKSYAINKNYLVNAVITDSYVQLNDTNIPISRRKLADIRSAIK